MTDQPTDDRPTGDRLPEDRPAGDRPADDRPTGDRPADDRPAGDRPGIAAAVIVHEGRVLMVRRRVSEGRLSWQFPAGEVEPGESSQEAAVRETREETGLEVVAVASLGERVHPQTRRLMSYTACRVTGGSAFVADTEELAELTWCAHAELAVHVPYGLFTPVQEYLDAALAAG